MDKDDEGHNTVLNVEPHDSAYHEGSFDPHAWIGRSKDYNTVPEYVKAAFARIIEIPTDFPTNLNPLPPKTLVVKDLLSSKLPTVSQGHSLYAVDAAFSVSPPDTNILLLFQRVVPKPQFLEKLLMALPQRWLDGMQSITTEEYPMTKYPLWAILWWKHAAEAYTISESWRKSLTWLDSSYASSTAQPLKRRLQSAKEIVMQMPWNTGISILNSSPSLTQTCKFAQILSDSWLSDDVMDMAIENMRLRVDASEKVSRASIVLSSGFSYSLKCGNKRAVEKLRERLEATPSVKKILFPSFLSVGHWFAVCVNLDTRVISYGQYACPGPKRIFLD